MHIRGDTLDDLLRRVISKLFRSGVPITPSRGRAIELTGVMLELENPRARLSRTERKGHVFSSLGELMWYLTKTADAAFIAYYLPRYMKDAEDGKIHGAYGPRLFAMRGIDQVKNVVELLRRNTDSRRAVIQLFNAEDIAAQHKEVPCTCTVQFMVRGGRLEMFTSMRSNDAYIGLPHDVFAFTMLQEIIAVTLGLDIGTYKHAVGSLHLYEEHRLNAREYVKEGWQPKTAMPPMPRGDPWPAIDIVLRSEEVVREGSVVDATDLGIDPYWQDFVRLLSIFRFARRGDSHEIERLAGHMSNEVYDQYIDDRRESAELRRRQGWVADS